MKNILRIVLLVCALFLSTFSMSKNKESISDIEWSGIKTDIKLSFQELKKLNIYPSSIQARQRYLTRLNTVINDFHYMNASMAQKKQDINKSLSQHSKRKLDRLALAFMYFFNQQNRLGEDYNSNLGANIFTDINNSSLVNDRISADRFNSGTEDLSVEIMDVKQLSMSDYQLFFDTSTHYILLRQSDNKIVSSGMITALPQDIDIDGIKINISRGEIIAKDRFTISPLTNAAGSIDLTIYDPQDLALGWPVMVNRNSGNTGIGSADIDLMLDTDNDTFSIKKQLNPPITIQFITPTSFILINAKTNSVIEGPIHYDEVGANVFPAPDGYDPGYRVLLSGSMQTGDMFDIDYSSFGSSDIRNGISLEHLYYTIEAL